MQSNKESTRLLALRYEAILSAFTEHLNYPATFIYCR